MQFGFRANALHSATSRLERSPNPCNLNFSRTQLFQQIFGKKNQKNLEHETKKQRLFAVIRNSLSSKPR